MTFLDYFKYKAREFNLKSIAPSPTYPSHEAQHASSFVPSSLSAQGKCMPHGKPPRAMQTLMVSFVLASTSNVDKGNTPMLLKPMVHLAFHIPIIIYTSLYYLWLE